MEVIEEEVESVNLATAIAKLNLAKATLNDCTICRLERVAEFATL